MAHQNIIYRCPNTAPFVKYQPLCYAFIASVLRPHVFYKAITMRKIAVPLITLLGLCSFGSYGKLIKMKTQRLMRWTLPLLKLFIARPLPIPALLI